MSKYKIDIELEMDATHVEKIWGKLHEIIKDENVKANVKSEYVTGDLPDNFSLTTWMQNGGGSLS